MRTPRVALLSVALLAGCVTRDATSPVAQFATTPDSPTRLYAPDIVAYWKFDDATGTVARDAVGSHHGTLVNGPTWVAGKAGGALHFDGVDDYVDAGYGGPDLGQVTTYTVEAWVRRGTTPRWSTSIIAKPAGMGPGGYEFGFGAALTTRYSGTPQLQAWSNEDGYWPWVRSGPAAAENDWSHVAVTCRYVAYAQREFHLFIDGTRSRSSSRTGSGSPSSPIRASTSAGASPTDSAPPPTPASSATSTSSRSTRGRWIPPRSAGTMRTAWPAADTRRSSR